MGDGCTVKFSSRPLHPLPFNRGFFATPGSPPCHAECSEESACHKRFFAALSMTGGDGRGKKPPVERHPLHPLLLLHSSSLVVAISLSHTLLFPWGMAVLSNSPHVPYTHYTHYTRYSCYTRRPLCRNTCLWSRCTADFALRRLRKLQGQRVWNNLVV